MLERLDLRKRTQSLESENDALRHRVTVAELGQKVDQQAQTDAQQMMGELQAETARQKQELQFYRGLVVRQYGSGVLRVQELRVRAEEEERHFLVLITLVQAATRDTIANGTVTFSVEGMQEATQLPDDSVCRACFTREYPTCVPAKVEKLRFEPAPA